LLPIIITTDQKKEGLGIEKDVETFETERARIGEEEAAAPQVRGGVS
jgi:hypothetical protein